MALPTTSLPEHDEMVRSARLMSTDSGEEALGAGGRGVRLWRVVASTPSGRRGGGHTCRVEAARLRVWLCAAMTAWLEERCSSADISQRLSLLMTEISRPHELRRSDDQRSSPPVQSRGPLCC